MRVPPAALVKVARIQREETKHVRDAIWVRGHRSASASSPTVAAAPVCLATRISQGVRARMSRGVGSHAVCVCFRFLLKRERREWGWGPRCASFVRHLRVAASAGGRRTCSLMVEGAPGRRGRETEMNRSWKVHFPSVSQLDHFELELLLDVNIDALVRPRAVCAVRSVLRSSHMRSLRQGPPSRTRQTARISPSKGMTAM